MKDACRCLCSTTVINQFLQKSDESNWSDASLGRKTTWLRKDCGLGVKQCLLIELSFLWLKKMSTVGREQCLQLKV